VDTSGVMVAARTALVLFVALVLQIGFVDDLRIFGVHPELLLVVAMGSAVAWGASRGAIVGFAAGLMAELFLSDRFGVVGLSWAVAGFGVGMVSENLARASKLFDALLVGLGAAAAVLVHALISTLFGQNYLSDPNLARIVGIVAGTSAILAPLALPVSRWCGATTDRVRPR
jgi:rod shape-determining protein MreD